MMSLMIIDRQFKRASELNQGMFDRAFSAYLVKHVPTASEGNTGWASASKAWAIGATAFAQRQADREQKAAEKRAAKAAEAAEAAAATEAPASDADATDEDAA